MGKEEQGTTKQCASILDLQQNTERTVDWAKTEGGFCHRIASQKLDCTFSHAPLT